MPKDTVKWEAPTEKHGRRWNGFLMDSKHCCIAWMSLMESQHYCSITSRRSVRVYQRKTNQHTFNWVLVRRIVNKHPTTLRIRQSLQTVSPSLNLNSSTALIDRPHFIISLPPRRKRQTSYTNCFSKRWYLATFHFASFRIDTFKSIKNGFVWLCTRSLPVISWWIETFRTYMPRTKFLFNHS